MNKIEIIVDNITCTFKWNISNIILPDAFLTLDFGRRVLVPVRTTTFLDFFFFLRFKVGFGLVTALDVLVSSCGVEGVVDVTELSCVGRDELVVPVKSNFYLKFI